MLTEGCEIINPVLDLFDVERCRKSPFCWVLKTLQDFINEHCFRTPQGHPGQVAHQSVVDAIDNLDDDDEITLEDPTDVENFDAISNHVKALTKTCNQFQRKRREMIRRAH